MKDILKFLRRIKSLFLLYRSGEPKLEGYTDSSFPLDLHDLKSISGFVFKLNGDAISWKSSKKDTTTDSTIEAEYIAALAAVKERFWKRNFVQELGVITQTVDHILVYYDNTNAKPRDSLNEVITSKE
ncbi:secreted RxLR effector protein 161-like [Primulina eburnea]|uniref:secreted RxLR effector protein 161-like n=1 Tax=Primulina eburnea TaxID=1245227 RepID=UPI003C6C74B4